MTKSEAELDAEMEADFQRTVAATRAAGKRKRGRQHMGAPLAYWALVCRIASTDATVPIALCIYRRVVVCGTSTITLPQRELTELGISRFAKMRSLARLEKVGLIRTERPGSGRSIQITLLRRD
jgi:hypothetical protein